MADANADARVDDVGCCDAQVTRPVDTCRHRYSLVPRFDPRDDALDDQLQDLVWVADRLGMTEAAGWIQRLTARERVKASAARR